MEPPPFKGGKLLVIVNGAYGRRIAKMASILRIETRVVEAIAPEASGKHRYVVSHVPLAGALKQAVA